MKRSCWICGEEYDYCPNCNDIGSWRIKACTPEHYQVIQIFNDYHAKVINAKEAIELFANIGITADSELNFLPEVAAETKDIIAKGTPKKVSKPKSKIKTEVVIDTDSE